MTFAADLLKWPDEYTHQTEIRRYPTEKFIARQPLIQAASDEGVSVKAA